MLDFSDLLKRANLNSLESYLTTGGEDHEPPPNRTYGQRIEDAQKKAKAFFDQRYTDLREYDEISGYFNEQVAEFRDVYFEIGLILGAKIAFQLGGRLEELS